MHRLLGGQWKYITQSKGCFWCHAVATNGAVLLLILTIELILANIILISVSNFLPFILILTPIRAEVASDLQECYLGLDMGNFLI